MVPLAFDNSWKISSNGKIIAALGKPACRAFCLLSFQHGANLIVPGRPAKSKNAANQELAAIAGSLFSCKASLVFLVVLLGEQ